MFVCSFLMMVTSVYMKKKTEEFNQFSSEFLKVDIDQSVAYHILLDSRNMYRIDVEKLQVLLMKLRLSDDFFDSSLRKELLQITDELQLEVNKCQSNISVFYMIMDALKICYWNENSNDLKIVITNHKFIEKDSIEIDLALFNDFGDTYNIEYFLGDNQISQSKFTMYNGDIDKLRVTISNPYTGEKYTINAK